MCGQEASQQHTASSQKLDPVDPAVKYGWPRENERGYRILEQPHGTERPLRVIHIGAGISGICMSKFLPEESKDTSLVCYEKNEDIGGTWLENRQALPRIEDDID